MFSGFVDFALSGSFSVSSCWRISPLFQERITSGDSGSPLSKHAVSSPFLLLFFFFIHSYSVDQKPLDNLTSWHRDFEHLPKLAQSWVKWVSVSAGTTLLFTFFIICKLGFKMPLFFLTDSVPRKAKKATLWHKLPWFLAVEVEERGPLSLWSPCANDAVLKGLCWIKPWHPKFFNTPRGICAFVCHRPPSMCHAANDRWGMCFCCCIRVKQTQLAFIKMLVVFGVSCLPVWTVQRSWSFVMIHGPFNWLQLFLLVKGTF